MDYLKQYPDYIRMISGIKAIAGVDRSVMNDGDANGLRTAVVYTATGLRFEILLDRGMDIGSCSYQGIPIGFMSKVGIRNAATALAMPGQFHQYFAGGLLTTCGIDNVGPSCEQDGIQYPVHGSRTFLQAHDIQTYQQAEQDGTVIHVKGQMRHATLFKENIILEREFIVPAERSEIIIRDSLENVGTSAYPYMILYHFNFSFPLVSPDSTISTNFSVVQPFNDSARKNPLKHHEFESPQESYEERVYSFSHPDQSMVMAELINPVLGLKASVHYSADELPQFTEWINLMVQDYVVGLEPGTHQPIGRKLAVEKELLHTLAPGEKKAFELKITVEKKD